MDIPLLQHRIAKGLASWLTFEFTCHRGGLFSEKYLTAALAQILAAQHRGPVLSEIHHPTLKTISGRGRPLQLDFALMDGSSPKLIAETKWAGTSPCSPADIAWDCLRLELAAHAFGCPALLIFAGMSKHLKATFDSPQFEFTNAHGITQRMLPLKGAGRRTVYLPRLSPPVRKSLAERLATYVPVTIPQGLYVSHPRFFPDEGRSMTFRAYAWQVGPTRSRYTLNATEVGSWLA